MTYVQIWWWLPLKHNHILTTLEQHHGYKGKEYVYAWGSLKTNEYHHTSYLKTSLQWKINLLSCSCLLKVLIHLLFSYSVFLCQLPFWWKSSTIDYHALHESRILYKTAPRCHTSALIVICSGRLHGTSFCVHGHVDAQTNKHGKHYSNAGPLTLHIPGW